MAKISGFRVRDEKFTINEKEVEVHHVELHVMSRAVGSGTGGELVAIYKVEIPDIPYVFSADPAEVDKLGLEKFLADRLNRTCMVEKTLVGKKEQICQVVFMDGGK